MRIVPVLYAGPWDDALIRTFHQPTFQGDEMEGYVVRRADAFAYGDFRTSVVKYARLGHDRTRLHWFHGRMQMCHGDRSRFIADAHTPTTLNQAHVSWFLG